jgi:hypothetical protein
MLGRRRVGAGEEDAVVGVVGPRGPHLLPVDHVLVAVPASDGPQRRQVAPRLGLTEELAPDLLAGQQGREEPSPLLVGAAGEDRGAGPPGADLVLGAGDAGGGQLVVDGELHDRVGVEAPRPRPVGAHQPGIGELAPGGRRVRRQHGSDGEAAGVVVGRPVHHGSVRTMGT